MKKMFSSLFSRLFGVRAESTPPPPPAPVLSAEDRTLDAIWLRYWEIMCPPTDRLLRRQDYAVFTRAWPQMLREDRRFVMVVLPMKYERDRPPYHPTLWPFPLRSKVQAAGGFEPFCRSAPFLDYLRLHVIAWQRAAIAWNQDPDLPAGSPRHKENVILNPDIAVFLLDPDETELVKVKLPRWPFPPPEPPEPPAPVPAKLIPPPTQPGIAGALRPPKKDGPSRC